MAASQRHDAPDFEAQPVTPKRKSLTGKSDKKTEEKREELKRVRSSKRVAGSPKEDVSPVATTAVEEVFESPRRKSKSALTRSKSGPTASRSPRSGTSSRALASGSGEASPVTRSKSSVSTSPLKAARRSSATTHASSPSTLMAKPPRTPRRGSWDSDCDLSLVSSSTPTSAAMVKPPRTPRRGSVGDCDMSTLSTSTPTSFTSSTKSSASPVKTTSKKSPQSSPSKGTTPPSCNGKSKYVMAPRRFSLPVAPAPNRRGVDDDMQTVYTEVDFDDVTVAERVPHHFVLLEEPSTINDDTQTVFPEVDFDAVPKQRVPQHFMSEKPSKSTTPTLHTATLLQRHFDDGSSGASANRIDAATVFTEVDFGATTKLEKNPSKSRLLDITETVQLQSIEEHQEEGSSSNLLGGKSRRRNSTTVSPRKTKVAEQVKKKEPRRNSMSEECIDQFHVWNDHKPKESDNHQRKQVMSELVVTQSEQQQQKRERSRIHRQGMDELMTGGGGRKTKTLPLRFQRDQVMSELVVTQSEQQQQKQERVRARNHRKGMDELMTGGGGRKTPEPAPTLPLRSQRKQVMSELVVTQSEQQQEKEERARAHNHRKGMDELMTGGGGKKKLTPTRKSDLKTAKRPPTPPRRRERLPPSPQKRSSRKLSVKQPMLYEKVAVTLREDNCHTHEWGPDAFSDNNLNYEGFADNKVDYQNGNSTTDYDDSFSDSESSSDSSANSSDFSAGSSGRPAMPNNDDLNASFKGLGSFLNQNSRGKDTDLAERTVCIQRLS
jgi:hypothetical protein